MTTTPKPPKAKPASGLGPKVVAAPTPIHASVAAEALAIKDPEVKRKDLVERVMAKNGMKRKDVKPIVDAVLEVLGEAIADEETLNLQPMGKFVIKNVKELDTATVTTCRIRRPKLPQKD
ncbi:HU family DNA-binding protein [Falsihalocynthiibacter sp. SS001]|uniref:HU family DNA-binding protein n=1 Tax=Falsihalocynthiibacter sp. SS001 TaxID=3349698 RepID=UPI0036D38DD9